jgi:TRAP-type C4-dicarboxylate transport system permease small subunit
MPEIKKEIVILNLLLILMSVGTLAFAAWSVISDQFKAGTDDIFLLFVCMLLALLFALCPLMWAYQNGYLRNPLKRRAADEHKTTEKANAATQ